MRAAAKMSLEQVKQWANSAYAFGGPSGRSSLAASFAPCPPVNVTFSLLCALMTSAPPFPATMAAAPAGAW